MREMGWVKREIDMDIPTQADTTIFPFFFVSAGVGDGGLST